MGNRSGGGWADKVNMFLLHLGVHEGKAPRLFVLWLMPFLLALASIPINSICFRTFHYRFLISKIV